MLYSISKVEVSAKVGMLCGDGAAMVMVGAILARNTKSLVAFPTKRPGKLAISWALSEGGNVSDIL